MVADNFEDFTRIAVDNRIKAKDIMAVSALKVWGLDQLLVKISDYLSHNENNWKLKFAEIGRENATSKSNG